MQTKTKTCPVCGDQFTYRFLPPTVCPKRECKNVISKEKQRQKRLKEKLENPRFCKYCGKDISLMSWQAIYCSKQCGEWDHDGKVERHCEGCGENLYGTRNTRWCNKPECRAIAYGRKMEKVKEYTIKHYTSANIKNGSNRKCIRCGKEIDNGNWFHCGRCASIMATVYGEDAIGMLG